jgi:hypothetical protein
MVQFDAVLWSRCEAFRQDVPDRYCSQMTLQWYRPGGRIARFRPVRTVCRDMTEAVDALKLERTEPVTAYMVRLATAVSDRGWTFHQEAKLSR